ncbi:MAG: transglycosylase SLT domain-containing protein [Desulfovibrionaceae bacterium]|nr:transglycosylase SLT domain-containing protein [Desulfovibrionaceae bacterium]
MSNTRLISLALFVVALAGSLMLAGFVPHYGGFEVRRSATNKVLNLHAEDYPVPIACMGDEEHVWSIRRKVDLKPQNLASTSFKNPGPVQFTSYGPTLNLVSDETRFAQQAFVSLLPLDDVFKPELLGVQQAQYQVDPIRFRRSTSLQAGYTPFSLRRSLTLPVQIQERGKSKSKVKSKSQVASLPKPQATSTYVVRSPKIATTTESRSQIYQGLIDIYAKRYDLEPTLVNAIIQSESDFKTGVVSPMHAVGLMQVLPSTASDEVHRYLYGKKTNIPKDKLHDPAINIRYGTAYLHLLKQNYFAGIRDRQAREYCTVAAYNMGPHRVVRAFGATPEQAARKINNMSAEEVYQHLLNRLPAKETRKYVAKVRNLKEQYAEKQK